MEPTTLHLDEGVLAIIGTLLMQTVGIVWWAATISSRVTKIETDIAGFRLLNDKLMDLALAIGKLEVKFDFALGGYRYKEESNESHSRRNNES